ncbi:MAG: uracil-DNA glycosylase family protein [Bacteroidia bacterium]|nr:uracil-DNA glycosylase family protein [Bacteroidia bacterium]
MKKLLSEIKSCDHCMPHLELGPRPVVAANANSKIIIIGQAPGKKVHQSGIPWDDPSGEQLRYWLDVDELTFHDPDKFALIPMGFCYPGKGRGGDLPPRPECAPKWHDQILGKMPQAKLTILIGSYSQSYYLKQEQGINLTERVKNYSKYLPEYFPIPHPSPRNRFWLSKNLWFEADVLPVLRQKIFEILND